MKTSTIITWVVVIVLIILGGWYFSSRGSQTAQAPTTNAGLNGSQNQTNTGLPSVPAIVTVATDATLGTHLVASNGMTLYMYTKDSQNVSNCSGSCATAWPPYTPTANEPMVLGSGLSGKLSTITRADGTLQVTYNGQPVYFWKGDSKPGDVTGQNVGGVWFVVKP